MTVTAAQIKALPSGEFSSDSDDTVNEYIAQAQARLSESAFGDLYDTAVKYMTAHLLSSDKTGAHGPAGPVTSESAGSVSRSYATSQGVSGQSGLNNTVYGRRVVEIRNSLSLGGFVV